MKKILSLLTIMLCMVTLSACNNDDPETESKPIEVAVGPKLISTPAGYAPGLYLEVTFVETNQVRYLTTTDILGFKYEEGYNYRLMIKEMRNTNSAEVYYILDKQISKTPAEPDTPLKPIG
ncbi:MAG: DUF4377 domain-containing protein [Muribaculaceae bacterium]|nr:DUF4377 domain-containing protein [Muribaculaceae bacterium]